MTTETVPVVSEELKRAVEEVLEERVQTKTKKIALVASRGTLDWAYPALVLATTAAALGWQAGIFFTFYGLNVVDKTKYAKLPVTPVGNPAMPPPMLGGMTFPTPPAFMTLMPGMVGMAGWMMKGLFDKHNIARIPELVDLAIEGDVKLLPCSMTMAAFGVKAENIIDGAEPPCGATTFLDYSQDADVVMFT